MNRLLAGALGLVLGGVALLPAGARAAASLPGAPPVSQSAFVLEPVGSAPIDNDHKIPAPSTPPAPKCAVTFAAAAGGSPAPVQARIRKDLGGGAGFKGDTICLTGTFTAPIHVRGKFSTALLTIEAAPHATATFDLARHPPAWADEDQNEVNPDEVGAIEIGDSRGVELYGLTIKNWVSNSTAFTPAGIYVATRADSGGTSSCFTHGDKVCGDIFLYRNTVTNVANVLSLCSDDPNNGGANAYGIAVRSFGEDPSAARATHDLQHVVVEGNTVTRTKTGQSETVTMNGNLAYFLLAGNTISQVNNIGLDMIGWEVGSANTSSQARHGLITANHISAVDTVTNLNGYGQTVGGKCIPGDDQAAGLYVDGGSYLWIQNNTVTDTNHGIELASENNSGYAFTTLADHLLVTGNSVFDHPGAALPTGTGYYGPSALGHAAAALMIDGGGAVPTHHGRVQDVYAHGNSFTNESQFYNDFTTNPPKPEQAPVAVFGNGWENVWLLGNTIAGGTTRANPNDVLNPVLNVNNNATGSATAPPGNVVDCNVYVKNSLSTKPDPSSADNFDAPGGNSWGLFADYHSQNTVATSELGLPKANQGWDHDSATASPTPCPFAPPS